MRKIDLDRGLGQHYFLQTTHFSILENRFDSYKEYTHPPSNHNPCDIHALDGNYRLAIMCINEITTTPTNQLPDLDDAVPVVALFGDSGAGKSTFTRYLLGFGTNTNEPTLGWPAVGKDLKSTSHGMKSFRTNNYYLFDTEGSNGGQKQGDSQVTSTDEETLKRIIFNTQTVHIFGSVILYLSLDKGNNYIVDLFDAYLGYCKSRTIKQYHKPHLIIVRNKCDTPDERIENVMASDPRINSLVQSIKFYTVPIWNTNIGLFTQKMEEIKDQLNQLVQIPRPTIPHFNQFRGRAETEQAEDKELDYYHFYHSRSHSNCSNDCDEAAEHETIPHHCMWCVQDCPSCKVHQSILINPLINLKRSWPTAPGVKIFHLQRNNIRRQLVGLEKLMEKRDPLYKSFSMFVGVGGLSDFVAMSLSLKKGPLEIKNILDQHFLDRKTTDNHSLLEIFPDLKLEPISNEMLLDSVQFGIEGRDITFEMVVNNMMDLKETCNEDFLEYNNGCYFGKEDLHDDNYEKAIESAINQDKDHFYFFCDKANMRMTSKVIPKSVPLVYPDNYDLVNNKLVRIERERKKLLVNKDALEIIKRGCGDRPISVLSVNGPMKSGKSYLSNRIIGSNDIFSLGHSTEPKTVGIWIATSFPEHNGKRVIVIDAEGFSPLYMDRTHTIFLLSCLLSNTFVYNTFSLPSGHDLDQLPLVFSFNRLQIKEGQLIKSRKQIERYLPHFVWVLRDTSQDLLRTTTQEYMKDFLTVDSFVFGVMIHRNTTKQLLTCFKSLTTKTVTMPTSNMNFLQKLDTVSDRDLNPDFVSQITQLVEFLKNRPIEKTGIHGLPVDGEIFTYLVGLYTDALNEPNSLLSLEDSWTSAIKMKLQNNKSTLYGYFNNRLKSLTSETLSLFDRYRLVIDLLKLKITPSSNREELIQIDFLILHSFKCESKNGDGGPCDIRSIHEHHQGFETTNPPSESFSLATHYDQIIAKGDFVENHMACKDINTEKKSLCDQEAKFQCLVCDISSCSDHVHAIPHPSMDILDYFLCHNSLSPTNEEKKKSTLDEHAQKILYVDKDTQLKKGPAKFEPANRKVVSFVGPSLAGKSSLIRFFINKGSKEKIDGTTFPLVSDKMQAMTSDLCGYPINNDLLLIDSEGIGDLVPCTSQPVENRKKITNSKFPRFIYDISNVIVFVANHPIGCGLDPLYKMIEDFTPTESKENKPTLIVVFNQIKSMDTKYEKFLNNEFKGKGNYQSVQISTIPYFGLFQHHFFEDINILVDQIQKCDGPTISRIDPVLILKQYTEPQLQSLVSIVNKQFHQNSLDQYDYICCACQTLYQTTQRYQLDHPATTEALDQHHCLPLQQDYKNILYSIIG
ncbi:hypothetical protein DFA_02432 [Cavenderia fasciculata]|uniref:GB1/RHD3-type G domain-containing protein n=1 Tax=Cavenderia fasciculata TaxID=261658 RepID=F4PZF5_CACFS|nr:uncharacterized protein DFA_02432 [Cavenderia fasciculata]EGG19184.1 hypothetical protein DFA_02432 [Cavenderia fasciculata]|eukprot:XP_004366817.1 hypothetical protein DFA_02432 [Cavenderia fasciculata]